MNILKKVYRTLKANIIYEMAIFKLDDAYHKNPRRYYLLIDHSTGGFIIVDRNNFRALKRKHYISPKATMQNLRNDCTVHTPYADGTGLMPLVVLRERKRAYIKWYVNR